MYDRKWRKKCISRAIWSFLYKDTSVILLNGIAVSLWSKWTKGYWVNLLWMYIRGLSNYSVTVISNSKILRKPCWMIFTNLSTRSLSSRTPNSASTTRWWRFAEYPDVWRWKCLTYVIPNNNQTRWFPLQLFFDLKGSITFYIHPSLRSKDWLMSESWYDLHWHGTA